MLRIRETFRTDSLLVIAITFVLFVLALFTKGFTHDLLLEAAVFLVSVKVIMLSYISASGTRAIDEKLDKIYSKILNAEKILARPESPQSS